MQQKIESFERAIADGGSRFFLPLVEGLPDTSPEQSQLKKALRFPFELIQANAAYPLKNSVVAERIAKRLGVPVIALYLLEQDPQRFGYAELGAEWQQKGIPIVFSQENRTMMLRSDINFQNKIDLLFMIHEAFHVPQIEEMRKALRFWIQFYSEGLKGNPPKPRAVINQEFPPYGMEMEAANLMMGNALQQAALQKRSVDPMTILQSLDAPAKDVGWAEMIGQFAAAYYPEGSVVKGVYPELFKELIRTRNLKDGFDVFEQQGDQLIPVKRNPVS